MNGIYWSVETGDIGKLPMIVSEYLLNDDGIFTKRERRMPNNEPLTAVTGFRVGYMKVKDAQYRMAPLDRNAILWYKITSVSIDHMGDIVVNGNQKDTISIRTTQENREEVTRFIDVKRMEHPPIKGPDKVAASWMCWRDDDEWEDPNLPLITMVENELSVNRYIEEDILQETILPFLDTTQATPIMRPKFCVNCGSELPEAGEFCIHCGHHFM